MHQRVCDDTVRTILLHRLQSRSGIKCSVCRQTARICHHHLQLNGELRFSGRTLAPAEEPADATFPESRCQHYFVIGNGGKHEAHNSRSLSRNQAAGGHGSSLSAVLHLFACNSPRCSALGRNTRRSGAPHAGRRSRSLTVFLRDARHHDSQQTGRNMAMVGADRLRARWVLRIRPHRKSWQRHGNSQRQIDPARVTTPRDRRRAPY